MSVNVESFGVCCKIIIIHPMFAIDEYAIIFRNWVWFSPPQPPIIMEAVAIKTNRNFEWLLDVRIMRLIGANFCHVAIMRAIFKVVPCMTSGNHRCIGASPIFIQRAMVSVVQAIGFVSCVMSHVPKYQALRVLENIISKDAPVWARKYLVVASVARGWCDFEISGMMAIILISNPSQASNQWLLFIVIRVPAIIARSKIRLISGDISKGWM